MNLFEEIGEDLFRPLTGINKRKYVDLLALAWDKCKRMPMYAVRWRIILKKSRNNRGFWL